VEGEFAAGEAVGRVRGIHRRHGGVELPVAAGRVEVDVGSRWEGVEQLLDEREPVELAAGDRHRLADVDRGGGRPVGEVLGADQQGCGGGCARQALGLAIGAAVPGIAAGDVGGGRAQGQHIHGGLPGGGPHLGGVGAAVEDREGLDLDDGPAAVRTDRDHVRFQVDGGARDVETQQRMVEQRPDAGPGRRPGQRRSGGGDALGGPLRVGDQCRDLDRGVVVGLVVGRGQGEMTSQQSQQLGTAVRCHPPLEGQPATDGER